MIKKIIECFNNIISNNVNKKDICQKAEYSQTDDYKILKELKTDGLHDIIPAIANISTSRKNKNTQYFINSKYPLVQEECTVFLHKDRIYISFKLRDYGIRNIKRIGYTIIINKNINEFDNTYSGVTYYESNTFYIDIIHLEGIKYEEIKSINLYINYILLQNAERIELKSNFVPLENKIKYDDLDKKYKKLANKIGSLKKANLKKEYINLSHKLFDELKEPFCLIKEMCEKLSELEPLSIYEKCIEKSENYIYIPIKCHFDKDFFISAYLARNCKVVCKGVSDGGTIQYIIEVPEKNKELLMILYYLTISRREYFKYMSAEQKKLQNFIETKHPAQVLANLIEQLTQKYSDYPEVMENKIFLDAISTKKKYFDALSEKREQLYKEILKKGFYNKWKSEYKLYFHIKAIYPDAIYQYSSEWLNKQVLDIFIPSISCGIEYQGKQHYESIDYFGGEIGLTGRMRDDEQKRVKCLNNGVRLLEWYYEVPIKMNYVIDFLKDNKVIDKFELDKINMVDIASTVELINSNVESYRNIKSKEKQEIYKKEKKKIKEERRKVIRQFNLGGQFVKEYNSISEICNLLNISEKSIINNLKGKQKTAGGFVWQNVFASEPVENIEAIKYEKNTGVAKKVLQISDDGELIAEYNSIGEASRLSGVSSAGIRDCARGIQKHSGGYIWKFKN